MIVAFDASVLVFLFHDEAQAPTDPETQRPVIRCKDRIDYLIATLAQERAKIVIPTPALAEILVRAQEAGPDWLRLLTSTRHFMIAPFDELAAVEYAATLAQRGRRPGPRQKAKFDDQILAIAAVHRADVIYSDDRDIKAASGDRFQVHGIAELPLPPEEPQLKLGLGRDDTPDD